MVRTALPGRIRRRPGHFNSLAPCGANPAFTSFVPPISIFQLTRPMRGEPLNHASVSLSKWISTHSPHAGRTEFAVACAKYLKNFNSLAPCGANPDNRGAPMLARKFQLTRPMRGEPNFGLSKNSLSLISTHSPHAGRTDRPDHSDDRLHNFNSLAPCGANLLARH